MKRISFFDERADLVVTASFFALLLLCGVALLCFQFGRAAAGPVLWGLACFAVGSMVGFLFGIPRILQREQPSGGAGADADALPASTSATGTREGQRGAYSLRVNTNLEQISDWLTKILVGVGLIQLQSLPKQVSYLAEFIARSMGGGDIYVALACAVIIYFVVGGFATGYMLTRLYLQGAFARADRLSQQVVAKLTESVEEAARDALASGLGARDVPTDQQVSQAERIGQLSLAADETVIREQVLALAREYERIRGVMRGGPERTRRMEVIVTKLRSLAVAGYFLLRQLRSSSNAGERLAAIAMLQVRPDPDALAWLSERFPPHERPFVAYHAAVALRAAVQGLPLEHLGGVRGALSRVQELIAQAEPDPDRDRVLGLAVHELGERLNPRMPSVIAAAGGEPQP
ncbi:MAG TPA: hypothetical protein VH877_14140 [Polyangia bacterium]|jgi:hypothetical protein|nr:hypothetical protein [Polyangia bacterium]